MIAAAAAEAAALEEDADGPLDEPLVATVTETVAIKEEPASGLAGALVRSKKTETKKS